MQSLTQRQHRTCFYLKYLPTVSKWLRQATFQKNSHDGIQQIQGMKVMVNRHVLNLVLTHWPGT